MYVRIYEHELDTCVRMHIGKCMHVVPKLHKQRLSLRVEFEGWSLAKSMRFYFWKSDIHTPRCAGRLKGCRCITIINVRNVNWLANLLLLSLITFSATKCSEI
jgi:hypothetical protein